MIGVKAFDILLLFDKRVKHCLTLQYAIDKYASYISKINVLEDRREQCFQNRNKAWNRRDRRVLDCLE